MNAPDAVILLADIGGTHARFAVAGARGPIPAPMVLKTAEFASFGAALEAFGAKRAGLPAFGAVAVCVAGPVEDGVAQLTNCAWSVSRATLGEATGVAAPVLINDFAAAALGIPALERGDSQAIGPSRSGRSESPIAILGPGTGLGVSGLLPDGHGGFVALSGEGGHVDLAPTNARETAVIGDLRATYGHVSAERVLSGPGLETLYRTLTALDDVLCTHIPSAAEIAARARMASDPLAVETVSLFTGWLGAVAGDLALTLGAKGGVYLAGGILPHWRDLFDAELFRRRFEAKGRFADYLAAIPTRLVMAPDLALRGLQRLVATSGP